MAEAATRRHTAFFLEDCLFERQSDEGWGGGRSSTAGSLPKPAMSEARNLELHPGLRLHLPSQAPGSEVHSSWDLSQALLRGTRMYVNRHFWGACEVFPGEKRAQGKIPGVGVGPSSRDAHAVPGFDAWLLQTLGGDSHFKHLGPCHHVRACISSLGSRLWLGPATPLRAPAVSQMEALSLPCCPPPFQVNICVQFGGV